MEDVKQILKRVSLGEATQEDRDILNSLDDDTFYSELNELERENYGEDPFSVLEVLINETKEEILELDSKYSEVIPETNNINSVRLYAKKQGLARRFLRKQRVKN